MLKLRKSGKRKKRQQQDQAALCRLAMILHPLEVKVFLWNPTRKGFKAVRSCQKSRSLQGKRRYQLLLWRAGAQANRNASFKVNHMVSIQTVEIFSF